MIQKFPSDHDNPKDSQLIICLTGTPQYIWEQLQNIIEGSGKPRQGTFIESDGKASIITPIWRGVKYL